MSSEAFVTLATNDGYALGALVLGQSIRKVGTKRQLVVMISKHLSDLLRKSLESTFDEVIVVPELDSQDADHLRLLSRPELGITFTKLHCWRLEQYSKCVFIDADCVVLQSIDDLFDREELSAAPDAGWPDCFNSGLFVFKPSKETHQKLMEFANQQAASFDGGDQGLLNAFFSSWRSADISRHIPFTYNVTSNAFYSYLPAVTQFRSDIRMVHFAGAAKPWQLTYNPQTQQLSGNLGGHHEIQRDFLLQWWQIMYERVWPQLSSNSQQSDVNQSANQQGRSQSQGGFGIVSSGSPLNYGSLTSQQGVETGSAAHRRAWEAGHIDYAGRDSFSHIQQQLERNIAHQPQQYHPSQPRQTTPTPVSQSAVPKNEPQQQVPVQTASKQPSPPVETKKETTSVPQSSVPVQAASKQPTPPLDTVKQAAPAPVQTASKQPTPPLDTVKQAASVPVQTAPKQPTPPLDTVKQAASVPVQTAPKQPTPPLDVTKQATSELQSTVLKTEPQRQVPVQVAPKQPTPPVERQPTPPASGLQNIGSVLGAALPAVGKTAATEHESSWNVQSTIVTQHKQGVADVAGPTTVTKSVTESSASSDSSVPTTSTITQQAGGPVSAQATGASVTGSSVSGRGITPPTTTPLNPAKKS